MTFPPSWGQSPPHSHPPGYPPSSSDGPGHLNGNLYVMIGELIGGQRWLISDAHRKTEQIEEIRDQLRDGSSMFKHHDARLTNHDARLRSIEEEQVSRLERLTKRWAAFLLPPATVVVTYWLTGNLDAALKLAAGLPK